MARGNWYGNFEYYSWTTQVKSSTRFTFINAPYLSNQVLLHASDGLPATRKNLPRNKYFAEALIVYCPIWLHKVSAQCVISRENEISRFDIQDNKMTLHKYTLDGDLKKSVHCVFQHPESLGNIYSNPVLAYHEGFYYTYYQKSFITVAETGRAKAFTLDTLIRFFVTSASFADFRIIVSTNKGCIIYKPDQGLLNMEAGFFAEHITPLSISFIQSDRFVILEKMKAHLFVLKDEVPQMIREFVTHSPIIGALPATSRHEFALVEENGKITICKMDI
jgi:hypothetical protein